MPGRGSPFSEHVPQKYMGYACGTTHQPPVSCSAAGRHGDQQPHTPMKFPITPGSSVPTWRRVWLFSVLPAPLAAPRRCSQSCSCAGASRMPLRWCCVIIARGDRDLDVADLVAVCRHCRGDLMTPTVLQTGLSLLAHHRAAIQQPGDRISFGAASLPVRWRIALAPGGAYSCSVAWAP